MKGIIVGVMGNAGSGKDTLADYLVKNHGFVKMSLADEMKRICKRVYDFTDEQLWGPSEKRNTMDLRYDRAISEINYEYPLSYLTPRMALQVLGTEWGRRCYLNTWVNFTLRDASRLLMDDRLFYTQQEGLQRLTVAPYVAPAVRGVVIPDCRFKNEIEAVHQFKGFVIRIKRDVKELTSGVFLHASEEEQKTIPDSAVDYVVTNNSSYEAFYTNIDSIMANIVPPEPL